MLPTDAELAQTLAAWSRIESPTQDAAAVNRMASAIEAFFAGTPCSVERLPGRDGLGDVVKVTAGPAVALPPILVLSHLDTVHPIGTAERGLPVRAEGDRLYGPGTYDMKGGVLLAAAALKAAATLGQGRRPVVHLFTPDEEIGSPTSRGLIEDEGRRAAAVLVTEPARDGGAAVTARKGVARFDVRLEGRPAHAGSRHQDGRSAIREAARQIVAIEELTDYDRGVTTTVAMMGGGTAANVVPQHAWFTVDARVVTVDDGQWIEETILGLRSHDPDVRIVVSGGMNRPPMPRSAGAVALYEHAAALARTLEVPFGEAPLTGGGSDGNFTAALGIPTIDGLGCEGDGAHTLEEYCHLPSLLPRARLMQRLLETL